MINADKQNQWEKDINKSVKNYDNWYEQYSVQAAKRVKNDSKKIVDLFLQKTDSITKFNSDIIKNNPELLTVARMMCSPILAVDRLAGLSKVPNNKIRDLEKNKFPKNKNTFIKDDVPKIIDVIKKLVDREYFSSILSGKRPLSQEINIAKAILVDRISGSKANTLIRNEQEKRQFQVIETYLKNKGYSNYRGDADSFNMPNGTYAFHKKVELFRNSRDNSDGTVMTPMDIVIKRKDNYYRNPIWIECKSAGDFANVNKRRKEEGEKANQLKGTYGSQNKLYLFLGGYFNKSYLKYEAANNMDWVWEHRVKDLDGLKI